MDKDKENISILQLHGDNHNNYLLDLGRKVIIRKENGRRKGKIPEEVVVKELRQCNLLRKRIPYILKLEESLYLCEYIDGVPLRKISGSYGYNVILQIVEFITNLRNKSTEGFEAYRTIKNSRLYYISKLDALEHAYNSLKNDPLKIANILGIPSNVTCSLRDQADCITERYLHVIHGDIHYDNIIMSHGSVYVIDWESCDLGDIYYEISRHLYMMQYSKIEEDYFLKLIEERIGSINNKELELYIGIQALRMLYLVLADSENLIEYKKLTERYNRAVHLWGGNTISLCKAKQIIGSVFEYPRG